MEYNRTLTALPVFNEAACVAHVLRSVRRHSDHILVVDDGSSDTTPRILSHNPDLHVITHKTNLGYGAALNTAFRFAIDQEFDVLVTIDCDGQHQPKLIPQLAERIDSPGGPIDLVSGSRYLTIFPGDSQPPADRRLVNSEVTSQLNERLGMGLTDAFCGFKAYRVDALRGLDITDPGYAMPLQVWVQAMALGWRIVEFPVPLIYLEEDRSFGGSLDDAQQRLAYYMKVLDRELLAQPRMLSRPP